MSDSEGKPNIQFNSPHPEEDAPLFGNVTLIWSRVEMALLNILLRLTSPPFKFKAAPFPQALARRLKLAKRGYTEIPAMASLKDQALPLSGTLKSMEALSKETFLIPFPAVR